MSGTIARAMRCSGMPKLMTPVSAAPALALALALATSPLAAQAKSPAPDVSVAFGNAIVSTYPDNRQGRLWLKADGSYTAAGRRNTSSSGQWSLKGEKVCLRQRKPVSAPFAFCTAAPTGGIGTSWKAKAVTGEAITVSVVKGVIGPKPKAG